MKAIVSSRVLSTGIHRAINRPIKSIDISGNGIQFWFGYGESEHISIHNTQNPENVKITKVNFDQWIKLYQLLLMIPEQLVVIEIDQIEDDKISIELSQIVARF